MKLGVLQFFAFALSSNWDAELARLRILRADGVKSLIALEASHPEWTKPLLTGTGMETIGQLLADPDLCRQLGAAG